MTGAPQGGGGEPATVSEAERQAFYATANAFLDIANRRIGIEPVEEIAAAFLYACARYNSFAMQAQSGDPSAIDDATVDYLAADFEGHLREHMGQDLGTGPGAPDSSAGSPGRAVDVLKGLNDRDPEDLSDFLDLGDRFIAVANKLIQTKRVGRISAAFMHACTRFNVYVAQCLGHPPRELDEALVAAFRRAYVNLVNYHLQETLVAPRG